ANALLRKTFFMIWRENQHYKHCAGNYFHDVIVFMSTCQIFLFIELLPSLSFYFGA
ncbi:Hypothetical protein FKW44_014576, partial [Caligus rogercresseyi]